jgi:predicted NAD/FAD-dependent oxidoreductase
MSSRRIVTEAGEAQFDHGAQYFTVRDPAFQQRVESWRAAGLVAAWPSAGAGAQVGVPAMNAPLRQMAKALQVRWAERVVELASKGDGLELTTEAGASADVDAAVLALPAEQTASLLMPAFPDLAARASAVPTAPCWTVMVAFATRLDVEQDCWHGGDQETLGWAARNSAKPGRTGPESWVLQAGPQWSARYLEADPDWIAATLKTALSEQLRITLPRSLAEQSHRWRFARSGAEGSGAIFDARRRIGICGDWLIGPRVEAAWLSGASLAQRIDAAHVAAMAR